jgi:hypothetical protein
MIVNQPANMAGVNPAPGWYPDPSGQSGQKYWDGQAWTEPTGTPKKSNRNVIVVISVIAAILVGAAVIGSFTGGKVTDVLGPPPSISSTATTAPAPTGPADYTSPEIQAALEAAPLPAGLIINEQDVSNTDDKSKIDVIVRINQPGLTGDPLKDTSTTIAQAIKTSAVGDSVASLRVSNFAEGDHPEGKVRVEDFQLYTWAPDNICCVDRAAWKYPGEE